MKTWVVFDHPTKRRVITSNGFSWGFFFFGSLWAIRTGTWSALAYQVMIWIVAGGLYAWADMLAPSAPGKGTAVIMFYTVSFTMNGLVASWCNEMRQQALLDHGYKETTRMEGPTRDFVEAELARGAGKAKAMP